MHNVQQQMPAPRRRYTSEQRVTVLADVAELGVRLSGGGGEIDLIPSDIRDAYGNRASRVLALEPN